MKTKHEIDEILNIKTALKSMSYDTWLILDLDNTVMESVLELGSDQWFVSLLSHTLTMVPEQKEAMELVLVILCAVQAHVRTKPVELDIVRIIKALQDIGIPVLALTARDTAMKQSTIRQLEAIGIDFSRNCHIDVKDSCYEKGVIFCSGKHKGHMWQEFAEKHNNNPRHIVMLDDKKRHLIRMLNTAQQLEINFTGLRYGFLDEKIKTFDMEIANHQLAYIKEYLPSDAQNAIEYLQLVPNDCDPISAAAKFSNGFFNHNNIDSSAETDRQQFSPPKGYFH